MSKLDPTVEIDLTLCVVGNMLGRNPGFATTQGQVLADRLVSDGYRVICASSRVNRLLRILDIISTLIRGRNKIDLIVLEVYSGAYFILADVASMLARLLGIPMIFVLHGGHLEVFSTRFSTWVARVFRRANVLIAPSPFLAKALTGLGLPIRVIPNIVEVEKYPFCLRSEIKPKLIWMRAFQEIYNPQMAIQAIELIRSKRPDVSLVMAGIDKGLEPEIKKLAQELGLEKAVRFPGFLEPDTKIREFSDADVFLNTNRIDNMPVAVIEARAMGLPVVATNVGGIPDLISNGKNGLLVDDGDARAMADAVISLLENVELAERISRNGRLLAERSSWESVRAQWEEVFDEIVRIKPRTSQMSRPQASNP